MGYNSYILFMFQVCRASQALQTGLGKEPYFATAIGSYTRHANGIVQYSWLANYLRKEQIVHLEILAGRFNAKPLIYVPVWSPVVDDFVVTIDGLTAGTIGCVPSDVKAFTPAEWCWTLTGPISFSHSEGKEQSLYAAFCAFDAAFWSWQKNAVANSTPVEWRTQ